MNANIIIKKTLVVLLTSVVTIFALIFIISNFVKVNVDSMGGNLIYPSYPLLTPKKSVEDAIEIDISNHFSTNGVVASTNNRGYEGAAYEWTGDDSFEFDVTIPEDGSYYIALDYLSITESVKPIEISILVNDELTNEYAENCRLYSTWVSETKDTLFDRYHNEILNRQLNKDIWQTAFFRDQLQLDDHPVIFELNQGVNTITLDKKQGELLLGNISIVPMFQRINYEEYTSQTLGVEASDQMVYIEAEDYTYKSDVSILPSIEKSPSATPFSADLNYLNTIGETFAEPGQQLTYVFNVENSGYYNLTLKYMNDYYQNRSSYKTFYLNNTILFEELQDYPLPFTKNWRNETLHDSDGAFEIYLEEGTNFLTIESSVGPFADAQRDMLNIIDEISDYSLRLKRLTGGDSDTNREWNIEEFLPETTTVLTSWQNRLVAMKDTLDLLKTDKKSTTQIQKELEIVLQKVDILLEDINEIPHNTTLLNEGANSISQLLSLMSAEVINHPIQLDSIYLHSDDVKVPKARAGFFKESVAKMQVYRSSSNIEVNTEYDIDVWVNRSRYYISMMQQMTDTYFTPETGIRVRYSVMPNESKLILANAAGTQPDLALGVSGHLPYELGLRGAAQDMREFDGFYDVIDEFQAGGMLHLIHDNKVYGLPETQDFYVQFYRKDIFEALEIEVPDTYDEIIEILPTLQRYGMNYYLPLSAESALKGWAATAPFIYQYGANYYTEDAYSANIDTPEALEGISMMIDLYTVYSLPLQTPNFYNHFREGILPIGVANFNTYVQLQFAAPELSGKWGVALAPGVKQEDGSIRRDNVGTAQASIIFKKSEKKEEAWELLKWWLSDDVQIKFTNDLLITFGDGFFWNSANLDAFASLPLDQEDLDIILEQMSYVHEVPKIPGGYKMERELSNVWNSVVFNGVDIRSAVDDAIIIINRELERKYAEFGYMTEEGVPIREYILPTIEDVKQWQEREE